MLDKLNSFCSHAITKIRVLVNTHHAFYRLSNTSNYIAKLLEKDKSLCNNSENMSNQKHYYRSFICGLTNYI